MNKDTKIDWKQICKKIDDGSLTTGEYTELLALIFRIISHLNCDCVSFFQDFIQAVKIWLHNSKPNYIKINGDLPWMETYTTSVFPIIVQYLNISDLAKLKMVNSQFNQAIIIKSKPNYIKINGDLPWMETYTTSVFPIIVQYLNISDLVKLKMVNSQFNRAINIKIIPKIKQLNYMMCYFNRTYFKYSRKSCLSSIGLDHLDCPDLTIFDILLYLVDN